jgi:hypothetical protein
MNDRDLSDIIHDHKMAKLIMKHHQLPMLCSVCGEVTESTTETVGVDILDRWGGVCWGMQKEVPVWKCKHGHTIRITIIGGLKDDLTRTLITKNTE